MASDIKMEADGGVPVFYPTWDQFKSFKDFVAQIEPIGMKTGIVKVIPPTEWLERVPKLDDELIDSQIKIRNPIEQEANGAHGAYMFGNIPKRRSYTLQQWRTYCDSHEAPRSRHFSTTTSRKNKAQSRALWEHDDSEFSDKRCKHLEASYWKTLGLNSPIYGADVQGTLFRDLKEWNVANLDSLLNRLNTRIPGVNTSYIYCGSWKASFAWHLEDMDLHSINYIHFGAPKQWYSIPQADREQFYKVLKKLWPRDQRRCSEFLRHKNYMVSPEVLEKAGVQVNRIVHRQNEFMITFPYGYHAGFNLGYNVAESVNFATEAWIPIGRETKACQCEGDNACFDVRVLLGEALPPKVPEKIAKPKQAKPTPPRSSPYLTPPGDESPAKRLKTPAPKAPVPVSHSRGKCVLCPHRWDGQYMPVAASEGAPSVAPGSFSGSFGGTVAGPLLSDTGKLAHAICAQFIPETYIQNNQIYGTDQIPQDRYKLRCLHCKVAAGACFQCDSPKCTRAYHPTCAASEGMITVEGQYLCRFHRPTPEIEPNIDPFTISFASGLDPGDTVQCRNMQGKFFAGQVLENNYEENMILVCCHPNFDDIIEVPYSWVYPGALEWMYREPLVYAKPQRAPRPKPTKPKKPVESELTRKLEALRKEVPMTPTAHVPAEKMHLYGVEGSNGQVQSPFVFMGVPLPACLQRPSAL